MPSSVYDRASSYPSTPSTTLYDVCVLGHGAGGLAFSKKHPLVQLCLSFSPKIISLLLPFHGAESQQIPVHTNPEEQKKLEQSINKDEMGDIPDEDDIALYPESERNQLIIEKTQQVHDELLPLIKNKRVLFMGYSSSGAGLFFYSNQDHEHGRAELVNAFWQPSGFIQDILQLHEGVEDQGNGNNSANDNTSNKSVAKTFSVPSRVRAMRAMHGDERLSLPIVPKSHSPWAADGVTRINGGGGWLNMLRYSRWCSSLPGNALISTAEDRKVFMSKRHVFFIMGENDQPFPWKSTVAEVLEKEGYPTKEVMSRIQVLPEVDHFNLFDTTVEKKKKADSKTETVAPWIKMEKAIVHFLTELHGKNKVQESLTVALEEKKKTPVKKTIPSRL